SSSSVSELISSHRFWTVAIRAAPRAPPGWYAARNDLIAAATSRLSSGPALLDADTAASAGLRALAALRLHRAAGRWRAEAARRGVPAGLRALEAGRRTDEADRRAIGGFAGHLGQRGAIALLEAVDDAVATPAAAACRRVECAVRLARQTRRLVVPGGE